jgi:Ca-activated chloride channel family protein
MELETLALFRNPQVLLLLVLPAALLLWIWTRRTAGVVMPFDNAQNTRSSRWSFAVRAAESLPALLAALAILLLAGPQRWGVPSSKRALTNIQFCVDVSGSMLAKFGEGDRYDAAMAAIDEFLDLRKGDAFGLTFFGNNVLHWVPLTNDASALKCSPPFMRPDRIPGWFGGTEIGKALRACRKELVERQEGDRMIILISDGQSSDLGGGAEETLAAELARDGIVVNTIHIAEFAIPDEIVRIAAITGGQAFKPEDEDGLVRIFAEIDAMQRVKLEKTLAESIDDFELFSWIALGALGLLGLSWLGLRCTPW